MVAGLSLAYRGLLQSGRLCDSRLGAFCHGVAAVEPEAFEHLSIIAWVTGDEIFATEVR